MNREKPAGEAICVSLWGCVDCVGIAGVSVHHGRRPARANHCSRLRGRLRGWGHGSGRRDCSRAGVAQAGQVGRRRLVRSVKYFEHVVDVLKIDSSEGLLNRWLYGFDAKIDEAP